MTKTKTYSRIAQLVAIDTAYARLFPAIAGRLEHLAETFKGKKGFLSDTCTKTKAFKTACAKTEKEIQELFAQTFNSGDLALRSCYVKKHSHCSHVDLHFQFTFKDHTDRNNVTSWSYHEKNIYFAGCDRGSQMIEKVIDLDAITPSLPPTAQEIEQTKQDLKELARAYEEQKSKLGKNLPIWAR